MTIPTHVRDNRGLLAEPERRLLIWLARRLPASMTSDHLTALALAAMAAAGVGFASLRLAPPWGAAVVVVALAVNWFGDSLDGTLARVRDQQRPRYGFYVDHVIDLAGITFLMAGLAVSGFMRPTIALALLAAYVLVAAESFLAAHAAGVFRMSFLRFGPTELRIVLAIGAIALVGDPRVRLGIVPPMPLFDFGGLVAIVGLGLAFATAGIQNTRALYRAEPLPRPGDRRAA